MQIITSVFWGYHAVLCCAVLCCAVLCCAVLCCAIAGLLCIRRYTRAACQWWHCC